MLGNLLFVFDLRFFAPFGDKRWEVTVFFAIRSPSSSFVLSTMMKKSLRFRFTRGENYCSANVRFFFYVPSVLCVFILIRAYQNRTVDPLERFGKLTFVRGFCLRFRTEIAICKCKRYVCKIEFVWFYDSWMIHNCHK